MLNEVDGKISGNISSIGSISGDISIREPSISGNISSLGQTIVYDAYWGGITGDIGDQEDLQIELHERDHRAMTIQEIEKILYL